MSKIVRDAGEDRVAEALAAVPDGLALEPAERELVKKLLAFPAVVDEAAERYAPHLVAVYALELAQDVHRLLPRLPDPQGLRRGARSRSGSRRRSRRGEWSRGRSDLLGVSAPETM